VAELVAVSGAEGFIGSHLVEALVARGRRVRAMVQYEFRSSWGWLDALDAETMGEVEVLPGDVRDPDSVAALVEGAAAVYHLAALIAIPYSYRAPRSYVATNVEGTLNVLEAARRAGTPRVVHTSTSEVYGTARQVPIDESHPLSAQSPYAATKIAADKLAESYHLSFGLPVVTLRPFNTYGPRQSARAVIPTVISQIAAGRRTIALGSLEPTRDFTFVTDTAAAFVAVGEGPPSLDGRVLNAGSGTEISVGDLVVSIAEVMGAEVRVETEGERVRPPASEVERLCADSSALAELTGWKPAVRLEDGLRVTTKWLSEEENLAKYRTDRYTL